MNLKWYLLAVLFLLTLTYEYIRHVLIEGHEISSIAPSILFYAAIIVPLVLWVFSKLEKHEKKLANREKKLRNFFESTRDAVFETDSEGYFTFMNQAGAEMCALASPEEILGRHATEFWADPSQREAYLAELKEKGYVEQYPMRVRCANGEPAYWELTSNLLKDEEGNFAGIRGICRDVTQRRKLDEQLREYAEKVEEKVEERTRELRKSEEKYRMLVENATDGIFMTDMEGNFIFVNNRMGEIHGYTREELLGMHASKLAGARAEEVRAQFLGAIEGGETPGAIEIHAFKKDGTPIYTRVRFKVIEEDGKPVGVHGLVSDVTETKRLEDVLKLRGEKLAILNDMVAEISRKLDYNRVLKLTAEKAAELLEAETVAIPIMSEDYTALSYPAAYGRHAGKLLGKSKPLRKRSICGWVIRNKKPFYSEDLMKDRREVMEVKKLLNLKTAISAPLLYKGRVLGGITALNKLGSDAFTREDLQLLCILASSAAIALRNAMLMEEIKSYAEELKRSNELKDLFADIMRHDLQNPVTVIKGFSELLLDESLGEYRRDVDTIRKNAEKLQDMIESASKYVKLEDAEEPDFQELDLNEVLKEVIMGFQPLLDEKKMKLSYKAMGKKLAVVNPVIEDVFANLMANAIKYSPMGSEIVIEVEDMDKDWRIAVKDRGGGIPDESKEAVFDRFMRIDKGGVKGTGLGLAIVKRIVELHKGKVWVEDNPEGGSIFYVTIPKRRALDILKD